MKPIEARNQVALGPARCLQLALTGMSFRMFRAGITMAILALAVAFLVHMLAYGLIAQETQTQAWNAMATPRAMSELLTRLAQPDTRGIILDGLASGDEARLAEYERWSGLEPEAFAAARRTAERLEEAGRYLTDLPPAQQAVLLEGLDPRQQFDRLVGEEAFEAFARRLDELGVRPPLDDLEAFRELLVEDRPRLLGAAAAIRDGHERAIGRVRQAYPGREASVIAADPPADLAATLRAAGFAFEDAQVADLREVARRGAELQLIGQKVLDPQVRAGVARELRISIGDVGLDSVMRAIDSPEEAEVFARQLRQAGVADLSGERIETLAARYRAEQRLQRVAGQSPPAEGGGLFGLSERATWLIVLSFMVCVVGVANAMLMSVTERFTEIATMKCLGAMDRFVMMMFVFEAIIQGVVGGIIGLLLGIVLAVLRALIEFGTLAFTAVTATGEIAAATLLSLAVGIALAAVAAVGPSWVAARLAPMEAMRVE